VFPVKTKCTGTQGKVGLVNSYMKCAGLAIKWRSILTIFFCDCQCSHVHNIPVDRMAD